MVVVFRAIIGLLRRLWRLGRSPQIVDNTGRLNAA
jgi:hypothetical protein